MPSSCLYSNSGQLFDSSVCDYSLRFLSGFHTARTRPAVWRTHVGDTKNPVSASSIPVLPVLKKFLDSHRARVVAAKKHSGADDDILAGERRGAPLKLAKLVRRVVMLRLRRTRVARYNGGAGTRSGDLWRRTCIRVAYHSSDSSSLQYGHDARALDHDSGCGIASCSQEDRYLDHKADVVWTPKWTSHQSRFL